MLNTLVSYFPTAVLLAMIGFSRDKKWLRIGGIVVLTANWIIPAIFQYTLRDSNFDQIIRASNVQTACLILFTGGYLLFWAWKTQQRGYVRGTVVLAGIVVLAPYLMMLYIIGIFAAAG